MALINLIRRTEPVQTSCKDRFDATVLDVVSCLAIIGALSMVFHVTKKRFRTRKLRGPPSTSLLYGVGKDILESPDPGTMFKAWAKEYNGVYEIPIILSQKRIALCDAKTLAHVFSKDTWTYVGKGINWAEGEDHRKHRKSMAPAFNSSAIRKLVFVIYAAAYKVKNQYFSTLNFDEPCFVSATFYTSHDSLMSFSSISVDILGIAGFSYDFRSLDGKPNKMIAAFDAFRTSTQSFFHTGFFLLATVFHILMNAPTLRNTMFDEPFKGTSDLCDALLDKTGIIEPAYNQLSTNFPYLDGVVHKVLRLHPVGPEMLRQADEDDIIPFSEPVRTKSGKVVDRIAVTYAKIFRPERWLEMAEITKKAQEVHGHCNIPTFSDGPRMCLGKLFAIAELKIMLSMILKNFMLEMRDGLETKITVRRGIFSRPKVVGEEGTMVPLRIKRYEG
ncbi:cytochrome P450 [Scleroderma yunnanense]